MLQRRESEGSQHRERDVQQERRRQKEDKSERGTGAAVTINMENGKTEDMTEGVSEGKQFSLSEG